MKSAEYVATEELQLVLTRARTSGHDAIRKTPTGDIRIQIKGRAFGEDLKPSQRLSRIKENADCEVVPLVVLDNATLEPAHVGALCESHRSARGSQRQKHATSGLP